MGNRLAYGPWPSLGGPESNPVAHYRREAEGDCHGRGTHGTRVAAIDGGSQPEAKECGQPPPLLPHCPTSAEAGGKRPGVLPQSLWRE